jgi:hypothetical protein
MSPAGRGEARIAVLAPDLFIVSAGVLAVAGSA